jgi:hypothetical protein
MRSANLSTCRGTIELLGDHLSVPAEDGVRLCGIRHVRKRLPTQPVPNLGERLLLGVGEQQATVYLIPQNSVFSNQILVAKQQLLIDGPRDVGQDTRPIHELSPLRSSHKNED